MTIVTRRGSSGIGALTRANDLSIDLRSADSTSRICRLPRCTVGVRGISHILSEDYRGILCASILLGGPMGSGEDKRGSQGGQNRLELLTTTTFGELVFDRLEPCDLEWNAVPRDFHGKPDRLPCPTAVHLGSSCPWNQSAAPVDVPTTDSGNARRDYCQGRRGPHSGRFGPGPLAARAARPGY